MPQASSTRSFFCVPPCDLPVSETAFTSTDRLTRYDRETLPATALDIVAGAEGKEVCSCLVEGGTPWDSWSTSADMFLLLLVPLPSMLLLLRRA